MSDLFKSIERVWAGMKQGQAPLPEIAAVAPERCWPPGSAGTRIGRDEMYFTVRINEMHLGANRQWYTVHDPMVLVVTEFNYGQQRLTIPSVVGPNLIRTQMAGDKPKYGVVLLDTRVAGPHPYRGGDVDVSVGFYCVQRENYAQTLMSVVEKLSGALGSLGHLDMIAKTGSALLEGVDGLLGLNGTTMLAGHRISLATSPFDPFVTGFYGMIAPPVPSDVSSLQVRERRLYVGSDASGAGAAPYRDSDFVLLGISGSDTRGDEDSLPFHALKSEALDALRDGEEGLRRGKANLITAYQQMRKSSDMTTTGAHRMFEKWLEDFEQERVRIEKVQALSTLPEKSTADELTNDLNAAVKRIGY